MSIYRRKTRIPIERLRHFVALRSDPAAVSVLLDAARAALKPIDALLIDPSTGPYICGVKPGDDDFVLLGEYAYARINPTLIHHVWESEELQGVKTWVNIFLKSRLVDQNSLYTS